MFKTVWLVEEKWLSWFLRVPKSTLLLWIRSLCKRELMMYLKRQKESHRLSVLTFTFMMRSMLWHSKLSCTRDTGIPCKSKGLSLLYCFWPALFQSAWENSWRGLISWALAKCVWKPDGLLGSCLWPGPTLSVAEI